jgi:hypothetical protein
MTHAAPLPERVRASPFAGHLVHELMGLELDPAAKHPRFDDDIWDLTGVLGAPIQLRPQRLIWDFTAIPYFHWQVMVREFLIAVRAPQHDAVATLPWARRKRLSLQTCIDRRFNVFAWLRWLADQGIVRLTQVTQEHCERYLRHRQDEGVATSSLKSVTLAIKDLARYDELFSTDRYPQGFMPWAGSPRRWWPAMSSRART